MESAAGFLCLLSVSVVWGQYSWGVTYTPTYICAIDGAIVEIHCTYAYPSHYGTIEKIFWFTEPNRLDLTKDPKYSDRVQYRCQKNTCTLTITDLRLSDSGVYKFRFITNLQGRSYTGEPGVRLFVTDLQIEKYSTTLWCESRCSLPAYTSYIWYKNGQEVLKQTSSSYSDNFNYRDSFSCALRKHKNFPSPSKCANGQSCNQVTYSKRSICAPQGSSVDISCTYTSVGSITSKLWFRSERGHQWQNPSQPEDLSKDSQYSGRVQVFETETGRSTLRITDLRDTDSAQYHFRFTTWYFEWGNSLPGTTLTVTALRVHVTKVSVGQSYTEAELKCHSSCSQAAHVSYVWFNNGEKILGQVKSSYKNRFYHKAKISCALNGFEQHKAPAVYAPKATFISVSSAKIMEGSAVTLTCSSDANPPANYTWYKDGKEVQHGPEGTYHFTSITSEDKGMYNCKSENQFGQDSTSVFIDVQYPPKLHSVSVSPSAEIVEGSSVNLTCSSDANPAANYTWYKENKTLHQGPQGFYKFSSISTEDSGKYYCRSENQYGKSSLSPVDLDVHYPPKFPSVSVSPSAEIVEGSSVNLTCSSDANPAAKYTWYKENEDSPKASGQIFTITDFRPEHSGNYYCEAQNTIGRQNSTLHLRVASGSMKSAAAGSITVVILVLIFLSAFLLLRKRTFFKNPFRPRERPGITEPQNVGPEYDTVHREPAEQREDLLYTTVIFSKIQEDPLYSNIRTAQLERDEEEDVDYTVVKSESSTSSQGSEEDPSELYSTVNKNHRT